MTAATPHDPIFRRLATADLLRELECLQWTRAEIDTDPSAFGDADSTIANGIAFLDMQIADTQRELARREQLRDNPHAPEWPDTGIDLRPFWEEIKRRVTVLDFWERHYLPVLRKSGNRWRAACPLCNATNESTFSIFADDRAWHCFRCGEAGDVFTLARWVFNDRSFPQVANAIADEFGIDRPTATQRGTVPETSNPPPRTHTSQHVRSRVGTLPSGEPARFVSVRVRV